MNIIIIILTFVALSIISFIALMAFGENVKRTNKRVPKKNYVLGGLFFSFLVLAFLTGIWRSDVAVNGVLSHTDQIEKQTSFSESSLETSNAIVGFRAKPKSSVQEFPARIVEFEKAPEGQAAIAKIVKTRSVRGVKILGIWFYANGPYITTSVTLYVP